jgi:peptidyl-prolyl cis-trans isomerase A (cyclophilin A)
MLAPLVPSVAADRSAAPLRGLVPVLAALLALGGLFGCGSEAPPKTAPVPVAPGSASDTYRVKFETTKGDVIVEVHPEWAPRGAARFRELVDLGYYDGCKFFRVIDGFMAQIGIHGDPKLTETWSEKRLADDPVRKSNQRGFVTFATAGRDTRTTQIFFNYKDNSFLDELGFAPFAQVVEGMAAIDKLHSGYGEGAPSGNGPDQRRIRQEGNTYLDKSFPRLDAIRKATILPAAK